MIFKSLNIKFDLIICLAVFISCNVFSQKQRTIKLPNDPVNVKKALAGNADSQAFVGKSYYFGEKGVKENDKEAFRWFQKSALKGSPYGYYYIGLCYSNGFGVMQNLNRGESYFSKAFKIFKERAISGDAEAQYHLGLCYQNGTGTMENLELANNWFCKASEQGHPNAQYEVALREKDKSRAFSLMKNAADHGIREAIFQLGIYYRNGIGCDSTITKGTELVLKSAQMGDGDAQVRIALCYEEGDGMPKSVAESFKWFKKAADENEMYEGFLETGCNYRDGHGIDHNYNLAINYLKEAADLESHDDLNASVALKNLRRLGRNVFLQQPKRCNDDIYELKNNDPFLSYPIRGLEDAPYHERLNAAKRLKRDKIHAWGPEVAEKTAMGLVDIGYTMEQIAFALRDHYTKRYIDTPNGTIYIFLASDKNYYFKDDVLFAMIWEDGMSVGDLTLIRSQDGNVKFIRNL